MPSHIYCTYMCVCPCMCHKFIAHYLAYIEPSFFHGFLFQVLDSGEKMAAKIALEILVELYQKGIWKDAKTVNVIASACLSDVTKLTVTALNFFLGKDNEDDGKGGDDSDSEDELPTLKSAALANKVNRKTKKREKVSLFCAKSH